MRIEAEQVFAKLNKSVRNRIAIFFSNRESRRHRMIELNKLAEKYFQELQKTNHNTQPPSGKYD